MVKNILLQWYRNNHRQLPWREESNPYHIWISEIILQQTRVNQGVDYYFRFIERFPDITSLAESSLDDVLHVWQGLGYYRRATLLHKGANYVQNIYGGSLPTTFDELKKIPGIGHYTAAAIASIAFNEPVIALDGNLKRIAARLGCISDEINRKSFEKKALEQLSYVFPFDQAGIGNQALMDLGALICTPQNPTCTDCPLQNLCCAFLSSDQARFPVKRSPKERKNRYFWYLVHYNATKAAFRQRQTGDIWAGLWEFPMIETLTPEFSDFIQTFSAAFPAVSLSIRSMQSSSRPHVLSHQNIYSTFVEVDNPLGFIPKVQYFDIKEHPPVSVLLKRFISKKLRPAL